MNDRIVTPETESLFTPASGSMGNTDTDAEIVPDSLSEAESVELAIIPNLSGFNTRTVYSVSDNAILQPNTSVGSVVDAECDSASQPSNGSVEQPSSSRDITTVE